MNPVDFVSLSVNHVEIDGVVFDTRTANIFLDPTATGTQTAVLHSADIMGMPVSLVSQSQDHDPGGNVPHQIVAFQSVNVLLFCRSDFTDFNLDVIRVGGMKLTGDVISVTYIPGS